MKLKIVGTVADLSELSDKMADLCEKLPIYVVVEGEQEDSAAVAQPTETVSGKRE